MTNKYADFLDRDFGGAAPKLGVVEIEDQLPAIGDERPLPSTNKYTEFGDKQEANTDPRDP